MDFFNNKKIILNQTYKNHLKPQILKIYSLNKSNKLTKLIDEKNNKNINFKKNIFYTIYWPSKTSFIILVTLSILYYILSHISLPYLNISPQILINDNHYQNFIAIHAGIAAIVFGLIIFIAESSRDSKDRIAVLLKVSYLFPIVVLTILGFFNFLWGSVNYFVIIFISLLGILVIYSVYNLISVLLNNYKYSQEHLELLKDKFKRSISLAVKARLGYDILMEKLEKIELDQSYYLENPEEFHCFYSPKSGIITDLDLSKLTEFSEKVEKESIKLNKGYKFFNNNDLERFAPNPSNDRYLLKTYKDSVKNTDVLLCINKSLIEDLEIIKDLESIKNDIFTIKDENESFSKQIRLELKDIRDDFIDSIKNEKRSEIDRCLEVYQILAQELIELLDNYGIKYIFKKAIEERSINYKGSEEINWLHEDVKEIFLMGIESERKSIVRNMIFLPVVIAWNAVIFENHLIFQKFMDLLIEGMNKQSKVEEMTPYIIDNTIRYFKTTSELIENRLKEKNIAKENSSLDDMVTYLLLLFRNLLIKFQKEDDLNNFENVISTLNRLFVPFENYISPKTRITPENSVEKELNGKKLEMLFRFATMLFNSIKTSSENEKFYSATVDSLPQNFKKFTEVFLSAHSFKSEDIWDIILQIGKETEVSMNELEIFYIIKSLKILSDRDKSLEINLYFENKNYNRYLASIAENPRFKNIISEIGTNPENWEFILSREEIGCLDDLKIILKKSVQIWEEIEKEEIRKRSISPHRVQDFKNKVIKEVNDYYDLKKMFKHFGLYETSPNKIGEPKSKFGLKEIEDKSYFFDNWHIKYQNKKEKYANNLGVGENSFIFKSIQNKCHKIDKNKINSTLEKMELSNAIIIVTNSAWSFIRSLEEYTEKQPGNGWLIGHYSFKKYEIPVILTFNSNKGIIIANRAKFGKLIQYSPINMKEDKKLMNDIFYMNIRAFSDHESLINEYLDDFADLLKDIGNTEEQKKYLEEKVLIEIYEKLEFKEDKDFEGYLII